MLRATIFAALALLGPACGAADRSQPEARPPSCANAAYPVCAGECAIGYLCATDSDRPGLCVCIVDTTTSPLGRARQEPGSRG